MNYNIKDIVKDNTVTFSRYRKGFLYYTVTVNHEMTDSAFNREFDRYEFPVPIDDTGDADFMAIDRAILFMRYIRKAIKEGTFIKIERKKIEV